jgi:uncharacterized protein YegP (UPF0339 family)
MSVTILESHNISTPTAEYVLEIFQDEESLFRWRVKYMEEVVGTCNQGYKVLSSVYSNIQRQAAVLTVAANMLQNK